MSEDQFSRLIIHINNSVAVLKEDITSLREEMNNKFDDVYKTLDYLVDKTDTIENELGFYMKQTDAKIKSLAK